MDFDDLLLQTNILLRDCPEVLARYQEQFQYILVDEYQDTNYAQYIIIRRLSQHHRGSASWATTRSRSTRSAGPRSRTSSRSATTIPRPTFKLEQNYRSTRTISSTRPTR